MHRCSAFPTGAARSRCLLVMLLMCSALWAIVSMISWRHHVSGISRNTAKCVSTASYQSVFPADDQHRPMLATGCETGQQIVDASRAGSGCQSNVQPPVKPQWCDPQLLPTPEQVSDMFVERWGKDCLPLRKACIDQGTVVVYQPLHDGTWPIKNFQLDFNHLDFKGFGDVIGIISYPTPIVRPGTRDEEAVDLSSPVFSNCSRPVVLYHNHLFMFGDFMIRLMPTYINAIKAATWPPEHNPAWHSRLSLILATGGQKMARWQKLMMAPLSLQPIVTLSEASSRAIPLMNPPHQQQHAQHDSAVSSAAAGTQKQKQYLPNRQLQEVSRMPASNLKPLSLTTTAVLTERCFESLTLCSLNNPRGFPSSINRPVWTGAQFIKDFWMQHYGTAYSYLLPHQQVLQQPGAFRVVFAIRSEAEVTATANYSQTVRLITNLPEILQWCNSWRPVRIDGSPDPRYSHTTCIAHEFGRHGKVLTRPSVPEGPAASLKPSPRNMQHRQLRQQPQQDMVQAAGHRSGRFTNTLAAKAAAAKMVAAAAEHASDGAAQRAGALDPGARSAEPPQQKQQQQQAGQDALPADPELDPRALLQDFAVLDHTDVLVGLHGAQLMNALFMPAHKSLVEIRPYNFNLGWPSLYFMEPMLDDDKGEGIFWFGVNTIQKNNSQPGMWEAMKRGCCYERDRHTRIEPKALDYLFRHIIDVQEDSARYAALRGREDHFITDTLQQGMEFERQWLAAVKKRQQEQERQQQQQQNNPG